MRKARQTKESLINQLHSLGTDSGPPRRRSDQSNKEYRIELDNYYDKIAQEGELAMEIINTLDNFTIPEFDINDYPIGSPSDPGFDPVSLPWYEIPLRIDARDEHSEVHIITGLPDDSVDRDRLVNYMIERLDNRWYRVDAQSLNDPNSWSSGYRYIGMKFNGWTGHGLIVVPHEVVDRDNKYYIHLNRYGAIRLRQLRYGNFLTDGRIVEGKRPGYITPNIIVFMRDYPPDGILEYLNPTIYNINEDGEPIMIHSEALDLQDNAEMEESSPPVSTAWNLMDDILTEEEQKDYYGSF